MAREIGGSIARGSSHRELKYESPELYHFSMSLSINLIMSTGHRKWAIEALIDMLRDALPEFFIRKIEIPQSRRHLRSLAGFCYFPKADLHFFMQQDLLLFSFDKGWVSYKDCIFVRYTHNNKDISHYIGCLKAATLITVENSQLREEMIALGINKEKIHIRPHPIRWAHFKNIRVTEKMRDVIFVSNFYRRKRPDIIADLVLANPSISFTIYGKHWETFTRFEKLQTLPNFIYRQFDFEEYPRVLAEHRVFCSVSDIEGGPVPLLESITAGLIPVVSDTGYARDVLPESYSKYIVPVSPNINMLSQVINLALVETHTVVDTTKYSEESYVKFVRDSILACT